MSSVPSHFQFLFPSSPIENLTAEADKDYIIETLLRTATLEAWQWMYQQYSAEEIASVIKNSRNLRKKDVMLWSHVLSISPEEILCLQTSSQPGLKKSWAY